MDAERRTHRCERDVAVEVMENCSRVISLAAWADMLLAWARDRVMGYMNVLGMRGDLPENVLLEIRHIVVTSDLCWDLGERKSLVLNGLRVSLCYCLWVIES